MAVLASAPNAGALPERQLLPTVAELDILPKR